jgi:arylsulfatase
MSGKWHVGTNDPTERGFEEFFGTLTSAQSFWDPGRYLRLPATRRARRYALGTFYGTDALTDHALDFLAQARSTPADPWFLYLAYNSPHFPLQARPEDVAKYTARYTAGWDVLRAERLATILFT